MSAWPYIFGGVAIVGVGFIFYRISKMNSDVSAEELAFRRRREYAQSIADANPGVAVTYVRNPEAEISENPGDPVNEAEVLSVRAPRP